MKDFLLGTVFVGLFAIPFLPLYVENDFFFPFITGKNFAFRIIVEIVFAAWILLALYDKQYRPKFSWLMGSFGILLVVMLAANLLGEYPMKSFWSNYERMDGFITLVHVFMVSLVMGSVFTTQAIWHRFLWTSVTVAALVGLYGIGQMLGTFDGWRGRLDSRLGNAAYMAVYALFHIFFVLYLMFKAKSPTVKLVGAVAAVTLAYALLLTATRGTFLGLIGGSIVTVAYIALFGWKFPHLRMYAMGGIAVLLLLIGGFYVARDSAFVQDVPQLSRLANINIVEDLQVRSVIWGIALEGIEERPLLGWGQGNFNYVFNKHYEAELWAREQWFDRVHNIFLDWLIAGGILGFVAYFSIFVAIIAYLFVRPVILKRDSSFSVPEQAIFLGLITAYLMHNLVVFDNIISYIFFAVLLALIHSRVATPIEKVHAFSMSPQMIGQFVAPIVIIITGFVVYTANVPGMLAANDIIDALRASTVTERVEAFERALERSNFADQEITEQLTQQAISIARNQNIPAEERIMVVTVAEQELMQLVEDKPGDARIHNFIASFYRVVGPTLQLPEFMDKAREQAAIARSLSPDKPAMILEQALIELQSNQPAAAEAYLAEAYQLAPDNYQTNIFYAGTLMGLGDVETAVAVINTNERTKTQFALNDFGVTSVNNAGEFELLAELYEIRVAERPTDVQNWASLAFIYTQLENAPKAIDALDRGIETNPEFAARANCYIDNIENGRDPGTPCAPEAAAVAE